MGNDEEYESNKVNILLCGDTSSEINKLIIKSVFESSPNKYEFKKMIDLKESKEYLYFSGELIEENITDIQWEKKVKKTCELDDKNIVICFSEMKLK